MTANRYLTLDGTAPNVIDPGRLYDDNARVGAMDDFWGKANSFTTEIGQEPGVFWLLVPRTTYAVIAKNDTHVVTWFDGTTPTRFTNLVMASAQCVAMDGDAQGAYLIELRDVRQRLKKAGAMVRHYNVTDAMPRCTYSALYRYDTDTLNGGVPWTWQTMFDDVWSFLPSGAAGTAPTLPWTPPHDPESWRFEGQSAWDAVGLILDACQSAIVCDPLTGVLSVVALGDTQTGLVAQLAALDALLDWKPATDVARAHRPVDVRVMFRARQRSANTVEMLDQDDRSWGYVDGATGLSGAESSRKVAVHSDLFDERDENGATLNQAALNATAAAIATRVALRYDVAGEERRSEHPGIVTTVSLGSEIHRMCWRDFGDDDGTRTEIWQLRHWGEPTHAVLDRKKDTCRMAVVKITTDGWSTSNGWAYSTDAEVIRYFTASNNYASNVQCETSLTIWHPTGYPDNHGNEVRALHAATGRFPARFGKDDWAWVVFNAVSQRWELLGEYEDHWRFELIQRIVKGGSGTAYLRLANPNTAVWVTTSLIFTVYDSSEIGPFNIGDYGVAKRYGDSNRWEILFAQKPGLVMVKATQCLYPGETAGGLVMEYDILLGRWVDTAESVTMTDPGSWNCLLIGEQAFCLPNPDGNYDVVGSHGLHRKGKAAEDISCGASGRVTLASDITSNSCTGTLSNCEISACNTWGEIRKVFQDEEVTVFYAGTRRIETQNHRLWVLIPHYHPRWIEGILTSDLCPDDVSASVLTNRFADGCPPISITIAVNEYHLSGTSGNLVLILRREDGVYVIIQVQHRAGYFAYDVDVDLNGNCVFSTTLLTEQISYMGCNNFDTESAGLNLEQAEVMTGWSISHTEGNQSGSGLPEAGTCQLTITKKNVCVFDGPGADSQTIIDLTPQVVLQDVDIDGLCFVGTVRVVYPLCSDAADTVTLFCGTNCGSGSGSQSGGQ